MRRLVGMSMAVVALAACSANPNGGDSSAGQSQTAVSESASGAASPSASAVAVPTVPGYDVGVFPEVPAIKLPDVSLLTESAPAFAIDVEQRFADVKGITVSSALCDASGNRSTSGQSLYGGSSSAVTNYGNGAGTFTDGEVTIVNYGNGSGSITTPDIEITLRGNGAGEYTAPGLDITVYNNGAGNVEAGAAETINNGDGSGSYTDGEIEIINNGNGSGSYTDDQIEIVNYGDGRGLVTAGGQDYDVEVDPLPKLSPVGSFPTLEALTPSNVCGILVTVESEVLFDFGSAEVRDDARATLAQVAQALNEVQAPEAEVIGHTDSIDTEEFNQKLSEDRAAAVVQVLEDEGVTATLEATGKGESEPVAPNENEDGSDNPAGRQLNRRVEIFIPAF